MRTRSLRHAYTLIEMLTVIAITAILLTIIAIPVMQGFGFTRTAISFADAQSKASVLSERIAREISDSTGVRDLSASDRYSVNGTVVNVPRHAVAITVPKVNLDGTVVSTGTPTLTTVLLPYAKIDIQPAAQGDPSNKDSSGAYYNPDTGKYDPTLVASRGPVVLPVAPGGTIVRYWVGRKDPFKPYNDPYTGLLNPKNGDADNLYVLYRAEVPVNSTYFYQGSNGLVMDDPYFFEPNADWPDGTSGGAAKATMVRAWQSRAVIQTDLSRSDMILPQYDKSSRKVTNLNGIPSILGMVQFRPERVNNDAATGATASRLGEETDSAAAVGASVFTTRYTSWSNATVRLYPNGYDPSSAPGYEVGFKHPLAGISGYPSGISVYGLLPSSGSVADELAGTELFDVDTYDSVTAGAANSYLPFTAAVMAANARTGWLENSSLRQIFVPFAPQAGRGKIVASFGIEQVGGSTAVSPNIPTVSAGLAETPTQDVGTGAVWSGTSYEINRAFNRAYNQYKELQPQLHRFIDLRTVAAPDGTLPPSYPNHIAGTATGFVTDNGVTLNSRMRIEVGSEQVTGGDQLPGPHYGLPILYTRVTHNPGPNQYAINYIDQPEPTNSTTGAIDYSVAFPGMSNPPKAYDDTDFVSAVLQPRFRAGYIQLNSDPNSPIPNTVPITVTYRFQFTGGKDSNGSGDHVAVDYDSRQLIAVLLTIRNIPQSGTVSVPNPQAVTLKATANVRNYLR